MRKVLVFSDQAKPNQNQLNKIIASKNKGVDENSINLSLCYT
jgi:hypothetical protein